MQPFFTKLVNSSFDETIAKVTELLKEQGFGILTEINVTQTLKNKLDVDFRPYRILGACNPRFAHKALSTYDKVGIMMPCNVVVQEHEDGKVEISFISPKETIKALPEAGLEDFACEVTEALQKVYSQM